MHRFGTVICSEAVKCIYSIDIMKPSIYNSFIPVSERSFLLYNAFTDKYIVCRKELVSLLRDAYTELAETDPAFYKNLTEGGFLVADELDEEIRAVEEGMKRCDNASSYRLIINPTLNCNFKCWYCYEDHSAYAKMDVQTVARVERFLTRMFGNHDIRDVSLSFFGGEPLLYYNETVRPLIDHIRRCRHEGAPTYSIHFTTNGYLITESMLQHLCESDDSKSFQITLDGNRKEHDKVRFPASGGGSYDRILMNVCRLLEKRMEVVLRINFTAANMYSLPDILEDLKGVSKEERRYLSIDFQRVWQEKTIDNADRRLEENIEAFRQEFPRVVEHYQRIDSFRSPCYGDLQNECVINYNGDVYKCTARDFTPANRAGILTETGEIEWLCPDFVRQRLREKFGKKVCRRCRIFPLCGAGCVQTALEARNGCTMCKTEEEKDHAILTRFYHQIVKSRQYDQP